MSAITTYFGPIVSLRTSNANQAVPHLYLDSNTTVTVAGQLTTNGYVTTTGEVISTGTLNFLNAEMLSKRTSASGSSVYLADGEWAITNLSVTSCTIQYRSGNTTYTFRADAASVL